MVSRLSQDLGTVRPRIGPTPALPEDVGLLSFRLEAGTGGRNPLGQRRASHRTGGTCYFFFTFMYSGGGTAREFRGVFFFPFSIILTILRLNETAFFPETLMTGTKGLIADGRGVWQEDRR